MKSAALLLALLSTAADAQGRFDRFCSRSAEGRSHRGFVCEVPVALCDAITADDKSGAWECMRGDGTMASGSATTFVATGAPTNTTENGWPVRTYTTAQNDQQPANAAFPASSFTVCQHMRLSALAVSQLAAFGTSGATANLSTLPWEVQGAGGDWRTYTSDGVVPHNYASAASFTASAWTFACFSYQRVGGAADNIGRNYVNGTPGATSSSLRLVQALSSKWTTNGYVGGATGSAKSVRGFFVTYKVLSADDIARIYARLGP